MEQAERCQTSLDLQLRSTTVSPSGHEDTIQQVFPWSYAGGATILSLAEELHAVIWNKICVMYSTVANRSCSYVSVHRCSWTPIISAVKKQSVSAVEKVYWSVGCHLRRIFHAISFPIFYLLFTVNICSLVLRSAYTLNLARSCGLLLLLRAHCTHSLLLPAFLLHTFWPYSLFFSVVCPQPSSSLSSLAPTPSSRAGALDPKLCPGVRASLISRVAPVRAAAGRVAAVVRES